MQTTVVMLILLGGLGSHNQASDLPPIPPQATVSAAQSSTDNPSYNSAPVDYSRYTPGQYSGDDSSDGGSFRTCVRNTFCSFFIGRDPGVSSAREIEEAFYSGYPVR